MTSPYRILSLQVISLKAVAVYLTFLKHEQISKDGVFIDSIPFFLSVFGDRLAKVDSFASLTHGSVYQFRRIDG